MKGFISLISKGLTLPYESSLLLQKSFSRRKMKISTANLPDSRETMSLETYACLSSTFMKASRQTFHFYKGTERDLVTSCQGQFLITVSNRSKMGKMIEMGKKEVVNN